MAKWHTVTSGSTNGLVSLRQIIYYRIHDIPRCRLHKSIIDRQT